MDFLDPAESFSVADWVRMAGECAGDILSRGKIPVICGGTGLYISSFVDNLQFDESECDYAFREEMRRFAEEHGAEALLEKLREVDPETAGELHANNMSRVIRALEVYRTTGHTIAESKRASRSAPSPYEFILLTLDFEDRTQLHDRINRRVDLMIRNGLEQEARACFEQPERPTAAQAIGCKELYPYFRGERTLEECVEELKLRTRQYAKRQLTWFRRDSRFHRIVVRPGDGLAEVTRMASEIIDREL